MSPGDEHDSFGGVGGSGQTRTRLPEGNSGDPYGTPRRPARASRSLVTVVGVVVLLVGALALANRGGPGNTPATPSAPRAGSPGEAAPTTATGVRPVTGKNGPIPTGHAHDEQGAQSAATNYAVALGSAEMFRPASRHDIVRAVYAPAVVDGFLKKFDATYSTALLTSAGLDANGIAPTGTTLVSRTVPVGAKVREYGENSATVEVWCTNLGGLAGPDSTRPVTSTWFTVTAKLTWVEEDWRLESSSQSEGPTPVNGDDRASSADEIAGAVQGYGGFTYAR